jgi:hypothetical protein
VEGDLGGVCWWSPDTGMGARPLIMKICPVESRSCVGFGGSLVILAIQEAEIGKIVV